MTRVPLAILAVAAAALSAPAAAAPPGLPTGFQGRTVAVPGAEIFVQFGGSGDPVVLLHGHPERATCGGRWRRRWRRTTP
ncbi:hypothetical protein KXR53_04900 [Inquilinus limosus]|uniref:hypothetical protein n=1 Tax=Inquilinus limosus TaxID=171674 RepID=UPI003F1438DB